MLYSGANISITYRKFMPEKRSVVSLQIYIYIYNLQLVALLFSYLSPALWGFLFFIWTVTVTAACYIYKDTENIYREKNYTQNWFNSTTWLKHMNKSTDVSKLNWRLLDSDTFLVWIVRKSPEKITGRRERRHGVCWRVNRRDGRRRRRRRRRIWIIHKGFRSPLSVFTYKVNGSVH